MTFTTLEFLRASRARGLEDRASASSLHVWMVECACCRPRAGGRLTLRLTEDYRDGPARVSCLNGCSEAAILSALGLGEHASSGSLLAPLAAESGESRRRTLRFYDVDTMLRTQPPPIPWLLPGILARGTLTLLAGQPKTGKSMLGLRFAAAIGHGASVLGRQCEQGRALIIDGENGEEIAHRRASGRPDDGALVFPGIDGRTVTREAWKSWTRRTWAEAWKAASTGRVERTPRVYDLRHSFVSLLLAEGRAIHYVAAQAGHDAQLTPRLAQARRGMPTAPSSVERRHLCPPSPLDLSRRPPFAP